MCLNVIVVHNIYATENMRGRYYMIVAECLAWLLIVNIFKHHGVPPSILNPLGRSYGWKRTKIPLCQLTLLSFAEKTVINHH